MLYCTKFTSGIIIGYTEPPQSQPTMPNPTVALYTRDANGTFVHLNNLQQINQVSTETRAPVQTKSANMVPSSGHDFSKWTPLDFTDPAPLTAFTPVDPQPLAQCRNLCDSGVIFTSIDKLGGWDGWPSGRFAMDLTSMSFLTLRSCRFTGQPGTMGVIVLAV